MNMNEYDQTKRMLNTLRGITNKTTKGLHEQVERPQNPSVGVDDQQQQQSQQQPQNEPQQQNVEDGGDIEVINNVDVKIHSDSELRDEDKGKISQLIDDFRSEVAEIVDFGALDLYPESGKLSGKLGNLGIEFVLSAGDDEGVYLNNMSLLKIDETSIDIINKLKAFELKFSGVMDEIIASTKEF